MTKAGRKPGGGGRTITPDEARLWEHATRTLDAVKAKPRVGTAAESDLPAPAPPSDQRKPASRKAPAPPTAPKTATPPAAAKPRMRPAPPLADFDRRKARQIASGRIVVDASIDLHGLRQNEAHVRLRAFLLRAHAEGYRTVLVITGKGGGDAAPDRLGALMGERQRGVIKRSVPLWLDEPELRAIVVSYTQAGSRHGAGGALYVQLRKGGR